MFWTKKLSVVLAVVVFGLTSGCSSVTPLETVEKVDLPRFMGKWYVIASIPTFVEKSAFNATETYALNEDGTVATTFAFRKGSFDGKEKIHNPKGFVVDTDSNAVWGMQFIWPIKADYRIAYVDDQYSETIIGRNKRDYVWIMARDPDVSDADYDMLVKRVADMGYDTTELRRVPHQWN